MKKSSRAKHNARVGVWGLVGIIGLFAFAAFLAGLGPLIEEHTKEKEGEEESSMFIEESSLDDIRDELEKRTIEINGQNYLLVDEVMSVLEAYLEEEG